MRETRYFLEMIQDDKVVQKYQIDLHAIGAPKVAQHHINLVADHLERDGWDEVIFKSGRRTKRFWKEEV